jgi:hypothetical protein
MACRVSPWGMRYFCVCCQQASHCSLSIKRESSSRSKCVLLLSCLVDVVFRVVLPTSLFVKVKQPRERVQSSKLRKIANPSLCCHGPHTLQPWVFLLIPSPPTAVKVASCLLGWQTQLSPHTTLFFLGCTITDFLLFFIHTFLVSLFLVSAVG